MRFLFGKNQKKVEDDLRELEELRREKAVKINNSPVVLTPGPSSVRDVPVSFLSLIEGNLNIVPSDVERSVIPIIRKLARVNPDLSQALNDTVRLANTGHKIYFDPGVGPDQIDKMREHLLNSSKNWHVGAAGINGIINKMLRQALTGGAISNEWIPNANLTDLEEVRFIDPETIDFVIGVKDRGYKPYQRVVNNPDITKIGDTQLRKLNTNQYRYYALNGDSDLPYGIPPYLAALDPIATQRHMVDNIKFIIETLGVLGYLDAKIAKPAQEAGESKETYEARLKQFLVQFKERVKQGLRDGVNVGFEGDHTYEFQQTAKTAQGVTDIFEQNELLIASGLNYDAAFMGRPGTSETLITILFTKMLAQLTNLQDIVKENLEFGYKLSLTLAGFHFKSLKVAFNRSTITDDLKYQQAEEIRLRNLVVKYHYGLISLEQMADELNYVKPDQKEPRIDINNSDPMTGEAKKQKREDQKDKSAKKTRDKKNPQGTIRRGKGANK